MSTISRVRYIRNSFGDKDFGKKIGVIEVLYKDGKFGVGVSLCNTKIDEFDKEEGKRIAHERAVECRENSPLLLKDLLQCNIEKTSGCNFPKGWKGDPFKKAFDAVSCYESIVNDMVYTLALSKVRAETA